MKKHTGYIMYQGPSELDGSPIVVIATMETTNIKTGRMIQVWILADDGLNPIEASKNGSDSSVCGNCIHRHYNGGACYVNLGQAPNAIYKALQKGNYPVFNMELHGQRFHNRMIRLGAYGDPAAAPYEIMATIAGLGKGHTGYTHQVAHKAFDKRYLELCMVSADSPKQAAKYQAMGAKTFRVAMADDGLAADELECLADSENMQCIDCGLCNGKQQNIAITVHGSRQKRFSTNLISAINVS